MSHIILTHPFKLSELNIGDTVKFHHTGIIQKDSVSFKCSENDYGTNIHFGSFQGSNRHSFLVSLNYGFGFNKENMHKYTYEQDYGYKGSVEEIFLNNNKKWLDNLKKEKDIANKYVVVAYKKTLEGTIYESKYTVNNNVIKDFRTENEPVITSVVLVKFYKYKGLKFWRIGSLCYKYIYNNPINNF
jgi:hypothetical protein